MKYSEYAKLEGLSSTNLSRFYESQDHALMTMAPSPYLEQGKAFERLLEDRVKGTTLFSERFFECDIDGDMPKEIPQWIADGEDLESKFVYNKPKKGEIDLKRSLTHKKKHAYLDACLENPGKIPIGRKDADMLGHMVRNMLKCELFGTTVQEILTEAEWQVPICWEANGIKKKALRDCLIKAPQKTITIDIKTSASISQFLQMARKKYWLQDIHYTESEGENAMPMVFLVAPKDEPWLAQPWMQDRESRQIAMIEYEALCNRFVSWEAEGKPPQGWKPMSYFKTYFRD